MRPKFDLEEVRGETFARQNVVITGRRFIECRFVECNLIIAGPPLAIDRCTFRNSLPVLLPFAQQAVNGSAAEAIAMIKRTWATVVEMTVDEGIDGDGNGTIHRSD